MPPGVQALFQALSNLYDDEEEPPTFEEKVNVAVGFALLDLTPDELRALRVAHAGLPSTGSRAMVAACDQLLDEAAAMSALASTTSVDGGVQDPSAA